jgi:hypothetical protein
VASGIFNVRAGTHEEHEEHVAFVFIVTKVAAVGLYTRIQLHMIRCEDRHEETDGLRCLRGLSQQARGW